MQCWCHTALKMHGGVFRSITYKKCLAQHWRLVPGKIHKQNSQHLVLRPHAHSPAPSSSKLCLYHHPSKLRKVTSERATAHHLLFAGTTCSASLPIPWLPKASLMARAASRRASCETWTGACTGSLPQYPWHRSTGCWRQFDSDHWGHDFI